MFGLGLRIGLGSGGLLGCTPITDPHLRRSRSCASCTRPRPTCPAGCAPGFDTGGGSAGLQLSPRVAEHTHASEPVRAKRGVCAPERSQAARSRCRWRRSRRDATKAGARAEPARTATERAAQGAPMSTSLLPTSSRSDRGEGSGHIANLASCLFPQPFVVLMCLASSVYFTPVIILWAKGL